MEKRRNRAARFNIPDAPEPQYQPPDEVAAKARRALKFGIEYDPQSSVLMDMGEYRTVTRAMNRGTLVIPYE